MLVDVIDGDILVATFNRPEQRNAIGKAMMRIPDKSFESDVMGFCRHLALQNAEMVGTAKVAFELCADLGVHQAAWVERIANSAPMLSPEYKDLMVSHVANIGKGKGY